ncbi:hypothetical protein SAMN05216489_06453 [Streptomyces sp. 3213]|uniref:hypothetical protein n=1 Tax=Streptomyces sp. 3213.3 TaxID=1855348 RepID=UPI00089BFCF6|nr:hypothetical protein [Streptomyces sp. 3213.3]SEE39456.1 hypothetical protein SAMN05216489_06453 [Streptomyces sp. 3213] [Streptomyces sp. 3213.3]
MPDAHSSDSADPFETRLAAGLRDAGGAFETDRAALVTAGALKGRRRLLRRRNAAVMSGAAGIALVGVGTAVLLPSGSGTQASPATSTHASATSSAPAPVSGQTLFRLLTGMVGDGAYSKVEARGTDEGPAPYVHAVYDDGKGKSAVELSLGRVEPGSDEARQATTCPAKVFTHYDACRTSRLADGSVVMVLQGYEYPDRRVDTKLWSAELVTPQGQHVSVSEWNAAAEKDSPITRPQPPLSPSRLTKLVAAEAWRKVIDAMPEQATTAAPAPGDTAFGAPVAPTLKSLLPKGLTVSDSSGDDTGFGYLVVDDGKGRSLVQVNVQANVSDVEGDLFGSDAEVLSDGTKVATHQGPGEKGGSGVVMWTVDTLRTDGSRVVISAFNSGAQDTASTRTTPALTMKQLREIALSPKWR